MKPLISIIIPVYNHAHTLERCVRSLLSQTYRPLEINIVNDGSTDNFEDVVKSSSFQEGVRRVAGVTVRFISQVNKGAPAARNRGFRESTGDYVMFYDADTIAVPSMLDTLMAALDEHSEASYAYSQFKFGWKLMKLQNFNGEDLKRYNYIDTMSLVRREALASLPFQGRVRESLPTSTTGVTFAHSTATPPGLPLERGRSQIGPFDETLKRFQDWDLWLTLLEHGKTGVFVPEVLRHVLVARKGMSSWLPSFVYKLPWKIKKVRDYEAARLIVMRKHHLL